MPDSLWTGLQDCFKDYVTPFSATDVPQAATEFTGLLMYTRTEGRMAKQAVQCRQA